MVIILCPKLHFLFVLFQTLVHWVCPVVIFEFPVLFFVWLFGKFWQFMAVDTNRMVSERVQVVVDVVLPPLLVQ